MYITDKPLDIAVLLKKYQDPAAGALVLFSGDVRNHSLGKEVSHLFYEAAESMAEKMMEELLNEARKKWKLKTVVAIHRTGEVRVGECAVVVITSSVHRKEAYEANRYIIEKIKHELPVWKCEYFSDGEIKWGGNCSCQEITHDPHVHIYDL